MHNCSRRKISVPTGRNFWLHGAKLLAIGGEIEKGGTFIKKCRTFLKKCRTFPEKAGLFLNLSGRPETSHDGDGNCNLGGGGFFLYAERMLDRDAMII